MSEEISILSGLELSISEDGTIERKHPIHSDYNTPIIWGINKICHIKGERRYCVANVHAELKFFKGFGYDVKAIAVYGLPLVKAIRELSKPDSDKNLLFLSILRSGGNFDKEEQEKVFDLFQVFLGDRAYDSSEAVNVSRRMINIFEDMVQGKGVFSKSDLMEPIYFFNLLNYEFNYKKK